jgi:RND family efflux transporter MFP subunit
MSNEQHRNPEEQTPVVPASPAQRLGRGVQGKIVAITLGVLGLGAVMLVHATARANRVALSDTPKGVTVVQTRAAQFRTTHRYVGTIHPWVEALVGPQLTAAYVDTVLVRPGSIVKRGQVLATLDCRTASAASKAVAMRARSLEAEHKASAHEAARISGLLEGGFVSANEAEQRAADTASKEAQLFAAQAQMLSASLGVDDCIMRAPFDGEISERFVDPGAFVRPGVSIVSVIDRSTVLVTADVPEGDFDVVAAETPVAIRSLSTGETLLSRIARRAPAADLATRTIHLEIEIANPGRRLPVKTTAELLIESGAPTAATELPLAAASVKGKRASLFVVDGDVAHKQVTHVVGESGGSLFVTTDLAAGARVVLEGRSLLKDGDRVAAQLEQEPAVEGPPITQSAERPPANPDTAVSAGVSAR